MYASFNGTSWDTEVVEYLSSGSTGSDSVLTLDSNNNPRIAYYSFTYMGMKYAYYTGSTWVIEGYWYDPPWKFAGWGNSIVVDSNDETWISTNDYGDEALYLYHKNGASWEYDIVDDTVSTNANSSSMVLDSSGSPHIAYNDIGSTSDEVSYSYSTGSTWEIEIVDSIAVGEYDDDFISLQLDSSGIPHLVYFDGSSSSIKYAVRSSGVWTIETVDGAVGTESVEVSVALDSADNPHIAYYDFVNKDAKYAYRDASWHTETIFDTGEVGENISLAIDVNDNPYVAFYDKTNGDLLCAYPQTLSDDSGNVPSVPTGYALYPAYPNPSNGDATIKFALPELANVNLSVYDIKGRKVSEVANGIYDKGEYEIVVNSLSSGVYLYALESGEFSDVKKLVIR